MKKICSFILLTFSSLLVSASFDLNDNMKNAYTAIINLEFDKGQSHLQLEKKQNPNNGLIYLNENYKDFLALIISEEQQLFDEISGNKSKRLSAISTCNKNSPYYLYSQAEINLQWAFSRLKFQEYFLAAYEIQRAYFLLEENQQKFPEFFLNKKGMGLLHCLIGSIPKNYKWIVNAIGINGGIQRGLDELHELLSLTEKDEDYQIYNTEVLFLISFLEMNLTIDKNNFQTTLDAIGKKHINHILLTFAAARLSSRLGNNEKTINILKSCQKKEGQFNFVYLDYLLGMSELYELQSSSKEHFLSFIQNFKGQSYIKSALQKIAWIAYLNDDLKLRDYYFEKVKENGNTYLDEDKQAQEQAENRVISHPILIRSRLLYDGGYYQKALSELENIESPNLFSNTENTIEYWYRMGRISQKMEKIQEETIFLFEKAITTGLNSHTYYAPMSTLQIAIEYERMGENKKAKSYYNKCLNMKDFNYERGIHQKAKAGLERISN